MAKKKRENDESREETAASGKGAVDKVTKGHGDFGHEIWGLVYLALGVLVLISLISHFTTPSGNILGQYIGTYLASGLVYLFGSVPAFFFPGVICYIGVTRLCGVPFRIGPLLLWSSVMIEVCVLLGIFHLPSLVKNPLFATAGNNVGLFFVNRMLKPIFGAHRFGPYFIISLALFLTVLAGFRINPKRVFVAFWSWMRKAWNWCVAKYRAGRNLRAAERAKAEEARAAMKATAAASASDALAAGTAEVQQDRKPEQTEARKDEKTDRKSKARTAVPGKTSEAWAEEKQDLALVKGPEPGETAIPIAGQTTEDVEAEARKRLEEELAAFRARKKEPIKIMSIETEDVPDGVDDDSAAQRMLQKAAEDNAGGADDEVSEEPEISEEGAESGEAIEVEEVKPEPVPVKPYEIPQSDILPDPPPLASMIDKETIEKNSMILEKTLMNFGVEGKVVFVSPGPVVTRYEIELAPGIKVSRVVALHDDISMAVGGQRIRIEAPIPGKSAVGIELPNPERQVVYFKHILVSDAFRKTKAKIPVVIGTNISGAPYITDITKMPHLLIAGQTGSGKSVCINSIICSILMTKKPEELRLIMIDPKKVEFAFYVGIPHLLSPVVTESKEAVKALQWGVIEMERRYKVLATVGARDIGSFNARVESGKLKDILPEEDNKPLPFIVIIVDELADLMMTASKDVEVLIQRTAQLARAVGIHLIVATQRPSVDIITGPIKANLGSRIAFRTIQSTDSRTILGYVGAEKLLGMGDMLFLRNGAPDIERFHGAYISEEDVETIVSKVKPQVVNIMKIDSFIEATGGDTESDEEDMGSGDGGRDELFEEAARIIVSIGQGSTSLLQRRMKIGYARAGRLMDELERAGIVGPPDGSKPREVLKLPDEIDDLLERLR